MKFKNKSLLSLFESSCIKKLPFNYYALLQRCLEALFTPDELHVSASYIVLHHTSDCRPLARHHAQQHLHEVLHRSPLQSLVRASFSFEQQKVDRLAVGTEIPLGVLPRYQESEDDADRPGVLQCALVRQPGHGFGRKVLRRLDDVAEEVLGVSPVGELGELEVGQL